MLLASANMKDKVHCIIFFESPNLDYVRDRETVKHFLMDCELYRETRGKLVECVADIWFQKKSHGNLNLSRKLLLGPHFADRLTSKEDCSV